MFGLSSLYTKLIGFGLAALIVIGLFLGLKHYKSLAEDRGAKLAAICTETRKASNRPKLKCGEVAAEIQFLGDALKDVRAKTDAAQAEDAAHAREVESHQTIASQESSHDYQAQIAAVRADYAERLRRAAARGTDQSRSGKPSMPGTAASASGPDAGAAQARLPTQDQLTATEQAIQLKALQDWARKVGLTSR